MTDNVYKKLQDKLAQHEVGRAYGWILRRGSASKHKTPEHCGDRVESNDKLLNSVVERTKSRWTNSSTLWCDGSMDEISCRRQQHPSKMKRGKRVKENENYLPVRTKRIRTSGRNGYEHQTQSCQLEKEVKDQENGSDQKIDDLVKC